MYEKTGNLVSYGEFGLDGDYDVQNASVPSQTNFPTQAKVIFRNEDRISHPFFPSAIRF